MFMMSSLCETHPTCILWICSYLNNNERLKVGLCSKDLFDLLSPLFKSLVYNHSCEREINAARKNYKDFRATESQDVIKALELCCVVEKCCIEGYFAKFWSHFNHEQLTDCYNPYLLDFKEAKNFYADKNKAKYFYLKKFNVKTTEAALRHAAASHKILNHVVQLLCPCVENINEPSTNGNTALHWAVKAQQENSVITLLNYKASCNVKNKLNETPLHFAAMLDSNLIAALLIKGGADLHAKDKNGHKPLDRAIKHRKYECIALLTFQEEFN